ncbi:hypothetical protein [Streptomyces sp. NBC_01445]|uniref:hypothetical protein n=1 Tax=Streptomyces sp. NBC_01445 TaxID=2903869 RepID=UPI003FA3BA5B
MSIPNDMSPDLWEGLDHIAPEQITGPAWDEPVPLKARPPLPAFPVDTLPPGSGTWFEASPRKPRPPSTSPDASPSRSSPPPPAGA